MISPALGLRRLSLSYISAVLLAFILVAPPFARQAKAQSQTPGIKTDRAIYPEPPLPQLPAAGGKFNDPMFGTEIMRATDATDEALLGCGTFYNQWPTFNADNTKILVRCGVSGNVVIKAFDPVNFTLGPTLRRSPTLPGGVTLTWEGATWSRIDPDLIFVHVNYYSPDYPATGMKLYTYRPSTNAFQLLKDFAPQLAPGQPDYLFEMHVDAQDEIFTFMQNRVGSLDNPLYFIVWKRSTDTVLQRIRNDETFDANACAPDKSGRWVTCPLNKTQADGSTVRILGLQTNTWQTLYWTGADDRPSHGDVGTGTLVGHGQWSGAAGIRPLSDVRAITRLFDYKDANGVTDWSNDQHTSLYADDESWAMMSLYDDPNGGAFETGAFENEVMQFSLTNAASFRRLFHHRSHIDNLTETSGYWAIPKATISRDGRFIAFTSNWENSGRYDLFIAKVEPPPAVTPDPTPTPTPTPFPTPTPTPSPAPGPTPTPTPNPGLEGRVKKAKRGGQNLSNQLASSGGGGGSAGSAQQTGLEERAALVLFIAEVQESYALFSAERQIYPAAQRIEVELVTALQCAFQADSSYLQGDITGVRNNLRQAIDHLELSVVLILQGNVNNPIDVASYVVRQHYVDFLDREPEQSGNEYWTNQFAGCGTDVLCFEAKRIHVSAAFFLSIEFQQTGYFAHRLYKSSYGRVPSIVEFIPDNAAIGQGVVVGTAGWEARLAANKQRFVEDWVQRTDFNARYSTLTNEQYVDALIANLGVAIDSKDRDTLIQDLASGSTRATVLGKLAQNEVFSRSEFNSAFVLMQYFGYLRRDPDSAGFNFWLNKLNQFAGNYERAEMVKAFLASIEYRTRFGI